MEIKKIKVYFHLKMAQFINSTQTLVSGAAIYLVDCTAGNVTLTIDSITYDYESYNINRIDNTVNTLTIVLTEPLVSSEYTFDLDGYLSIGIIALSSIWYPISGATKTIRV